MNRGTAEDLVLNALRALEAPSFAALVALCRGMYPVDVRDALAAVRQPPQGLAAR